MTIAGLPIVVAVAGGASGDAETHARWREAMAHLFGDLKRRHGRTPFAIVTAHDSPGERIAAEVAAGLNIAVHVAPRCGSDAPAYASRMPDYLLDGSCEGGKAATEDERAAECICRYSHVLVTFEEAGAPGLAATVAEKWRAQAFQFGDEEDDNDAVELWNTPIAGAHAVIGPSGGKHGWSISGWQPLHLIDRVNRTLLPAGRPAVAQSVNALLDAADWQAIREAAHSSDAADAGRKAQADAFEAGMSDLRAFFARADAAAIGAKSGLDLFIVGFAAAAPLAVFLYEGLTASRQHLLAALAYLAVILSTLAFGLLLVMTRRHSRQTISRLAAEFTRVHFFWRMAGVRARVESTLERWMPGNHPGVQMIARSVDFIAASVPAPPVDLTGHVHRIWVGPSGNDPVAKTPDGHPGSQTVWYSKKARIYRRRSARLSFLQGATFCAALLIAAAVIFILQRDQTLEPLLPLAISALPALAGAFSIYRERAALPTLAENYERMARIANTASKRLDHLAITPNPARARRVLEQFGREVIGESVDWLLVNMKQQVRPTFGA